MSEAATIDTTAGVISPTIEESYKQLKAEGLITDDNDTTTDTSTATTQTEDAEGGKGGTEAQTTERPSWLPEKFKSVEDMAKAYGELEKKMSGKKPEEGSTTEEAQQAAQAVGMDFDKMADEFYADGSLSDETYATLEGKGIPRNIVDNYISGLQAQSAAYEAKVFEFGGGSETYDKLTAWGKDNLSDAEIDQFDAAVNSGDLARAEIAVRGIAARMELAQGKAPSVHVDGKPNTGASDVYENAAQMEADMNNPLYQTDESFRQKVYAKLGRSNI